MSWIVFLLACIVAFLISLICIRETMVHNAGSITRVQHLRVLIFVILYALIVGTSLLALSGRTARTTVHIERHYQNPSMDSEALSAAESFDYGAIVGEGMYYDADIFPPYPYENGTVFMPARYQPSSVSYRANITRPAAVVNASAAIAGWDEFYYLRDAWMLANGSWFEASSIANISVAVEWLVDVAYEEGGACSYDIVQIIGLNATRDVIFFARGAAIVCALELPSTWPYLVFVPVLFVLGSFVLLEASRYYSSFKRPPRHVTAENVMENETRVAIVQAIRGSPGITFSEIVRVVVRSPRTILEHLGVLQRFHVVRAREIRHNTAFFDATAGEGRDLIDYFSSHAAFKATTIAIKDNPRISFIALQKLVGEPRSTLIRKVRILEQHGVVRVTREAGRLVAMEIP
ncbi:MAG: hypothetical protein JW839_04195 [Candidatus Lokiarchaeota archaeon]|nr:hypothetical protein [Candidatus Lokiarchaeota archaeon]